MSVVPDLYVAKAYLQSLRATLSSKTQYRDFANQVNTERNYLDTARRETRQLVNDMTQLYNANCGNWDAASSDTMYTLGAYFGRSGEKDGRDRFIPGSPSSDVDGSIPKFMYDNIDRRQYQVLNDINTLNQMRTANDGLDNDSILDGVINKLTSLGKYVPIVVGILTAITALASIATPFVDDFM
jgi:hypothetical protein